MSILIPPIGPAVAQFPARSQTTRLSVTAAAVSVPAGTEVLSEKEVSAATANPPLSVALQFTVMLDACHVGATGSQAICGGVLSVSTPTANGLSDVTSAHSRRVTKSRRVVSTC